MPNSTFLERKYGVKLEELESIEEIVRVVEEKSGKKLPLTRKKRGLVDRPGNVLPITSHDINKMLDKRLRMKW